MHGQLWQGHFISAGSSSRAARAEHHVMAADTGQHALQLVWNVSGTGGVEKHPVFVCLGF
jgi:hypothetical protein